MTKLITPSRERLATAEARMRLLLEGAETVSAVAVRLATDPERLAWLPVDLQGGDLAGILGRVSTLEIAAIWPAYQAALRQAAHRETTAYYQGLARSYAAAALNRAAPRVRRDDDV